MSIPTAADVKANLKIEGTEEDGMIASLVLPVMPMRTWQGIVLLASQWYESRLGDTGGFFADKPDAAAQGTVAVNNLLRLDRDWQVG